MIRRRQGLPFWVTAELAAAALFALLAGINVLGLLGWFLQVTVRLGCGA